MKLLAGVSLFLSFGLLSFAPPVSEAPTGFDNKSNGMVDDATHTADQAKFEEVEASLLTGLARSITRSPVASATRTPPPAAPARLPNCASATTMPMACFKIRKFPSITELRSSKAAL